MPQTIPSRLPEWLRYFETLDSTNNYAMRLINDGMAQHGDVIWANQQLNGKGQRGNTWQDYPETLKCSMIVLPSPPLTTPFQLSMVVAVTLVKYLNAILPPKCRPAVKWPNDIYINDKKACGLLIENIFRGNEWTHAIIGMGLNVHQEHFPASLKKATSLKAEAPGKVFDFTDLITDLRTGILNELYACRNETEENRLLREYNEHLYLKGMPVSFQERPTGDTFEATVVSVERDGRLSLLRPSGMQQFTFGSLVWLL